jgi:hypothetical protein
MGCGLKQAALVRQGGEQSVVTRYRVIKIDADTHA